MLPPAFEREGHAAYARALLAFLREPLTQMLLPSRAVQFVTSCVWNELPLPQEWKVWLSSATDEHLSLLPEEPPSCPVGLAKWLAEIRRLTPEKTQAVRCVP